MKKEMLLLFLVAAVSLLVMLNYSFTGAAVGGLRLQGDITDSLGNPVLTSRYNYWESAEGTVRAIPGKFNKIVAYDQNGRFLGEGQMEQLSYSLNVRSERQGVEIVHLKIGYYDPIRPETSSLVPCTTIAADAFRNLPMAGSQNTLVYDLKCTEMKALEKYSAVGYR